MIARGEIQGFAALFKRVKTIRGRIPEANKVAVRKCVEKVFEKAQYYVPVEYGDLKASGHIEEYSTGRQFHAVFTIVYDDPKAVYVHEMTENRHEPPTRSKFVEQAVKDTRRYITRNYRDGIKYETRAF